jgi:hypothetical protein
MPRGKTLVEFMDQGGADGVESGLESGVEQLPPPPEPEEALEPDPPANRSGRPAARPAVRVTAKVRQEISELLDLMVDAPLELWEIRDPHCGGRAVQQSQKIKDALLKIICKRPTWVAAMTDAGNSADWFQLAMALAPIGTAFYAHHVAHSVATDKGGLDLDAYQAPRPAA